MFLFFGEGGGERGKMIARGGGLERGLRLRSGVKANRFRCPGNWGQWQVGIFRSAGGVREGLFLFEEGGEIWTKVYAAGWHGGVREIGIARLCWA